MIQSQRPELIHTTLFEADLVGRFAAVRTGIPVLSSLVNTGYDPVRLQDPNVRRFRLGAVRVVDGWTSRNLAAHFHAITHAVKDSAIRALGIDPERITVIERGRDPQRLGLPGVERRQHARRALGLADGDEVLISVGRQEFQKGQRFLLEAMKQLLHSRPRAVLLIAGRDGHATAELQRLHGQSGLRERVRFLGHRPDVPDVLAAGDVFVFPSLYEGLGGAVIEAMAMGLPIVASALPALREVVGDGDNAVLVEPGAPSALSSAIGNLLADPGRAADYGRRSREIFEERFTIERSAERMIQLYRDVVCDAQPSRRRGVAISQRASGPPAW
jgi:glycosyltransferase involved in cell wall biosynthesis